MDQSTTPAFTPIDINKLSQKKSSKKIYLLIVTALLFLIIGTSIFYLSAQTHKSVKNVKKVVPTQKLTSSPVTIIPTETIPTASDSAADTQPPQTNIFYPQDNGTISYKTNGKICAIASEPHDDRTNSNQIQTQYAFDSDSYNTYAKAVVYLCKDVLGNGPHTLKYRSKDEAGNIEAEQTRHFTVAIEGN